METDQELMSPLERDVERGPRGASARFLYSPTCKLIVWALALLALFAIFNALVAIFIQSLTLTDEVRNIDVSECAAGATEVEYYYEQDEDEVNDSDDDNGVSLTRVDGDGSFMSVWTNQWDTVIWELSPSILDDKQLWIVDVMFNEGDGNGILLHIPADATDYRVFYFDKIEHSEDHVLLCRPQLDLRTSDPELVHAEAVGARGNCVAHVDVVDAPEGGASSSVFVDMSDIIFDHGLFSFDPSSASDDWDRSPYFVSGRSYPRNVNLVFSWWLEGEDVSDDGDYDDDDEIQIDIFFSVSKLPDELAQPRVDDDRIGFFAIAYWDLGLHAPAGTASSRDADKRVKLINRWPLEKDTSAVPAHRPDGSVLYPPKKAITYYIDPSVPERWRQYVKGGVEAWNMAFERIGFSGAVRAVLPGDADWPKDYDAGDIRYSSISWAISEWSTYALGPSTIDPRTGEILNADIVFTDGWVKSALEDYELLATDVPAARSVETFTSAYKSSGDSVRPSMFHQRHACQHERVRTSPRLHDRKLYSLLQSKRDVPASVPDEFVGSNILDTIMHEVGHTRMYRHGLVCVRSPALTKKQWDCAITSRYSPAFDPIRGSALTPTSQLNNITYTSLFGVSGSIMDYYPANFHSDPNVQGEHYNSVPGAYDQWAIEYGYIVIEGGEPIDRQHPTLANIAARGTIPELEGEVDNIVMSPRLVYGTDEGGPGIDGEDPYLNYWDLSAEPLDYFWDRALLVQRLRPQARERAGIVDGSSWFAFDDIHWSLNSEVSRCAQYAAKYIGGHILSKSHFGDPNAAPPVTPVSTLSYFRALNFIAMVMQEDILFGEKEDRPYLVLSTGWCDSLEIDCDGMEAVDAYERMMRIRKRVLDIILAQDRLDRVNTYQHSFVWEETDSVQNLASLLQQVTEYLDHPGSLTGEPSITKYDLMNYWLEKLMRLSGELRSPAEDAAAAELFRVKYSALGIIDGDDVREMKFNLWKSGKYFQG